ncbi:MAG: hypothetical protein MUF42_11580 [Cytophagaceae bacterium]|jgi:hypothetical protein|nr:hypothetical protein [Cytophagaceae bacterium]
MQKYIFFYLLWMLCPLFINAQILNIERFRLDKDTFNVWMGNVGFGFSTKKQKVSVFEYHANANVAYLSRKHSYMSINYIKFIKVEKTDVVSEGYTHARLNFFRRKILSYEPFVQFQYDLGRGLEYRQLAGFSFRITLHSHDKINIGFNSGGMWELENWQGKVIRFATEQDSTKAHTSFIKSTSNVNLRIHLSKMITFFSIMYYQAQWDRFFEPRFINDTQLQLALGKHFAFTTQFTSTLDALPVLENNTFIYSLNSSLTYKF